jgi:hypothetical protein
VNPTDRIQLIRGSLRVFTCGCLGLIPIIGIVPAIYAVSTGLRLNFRNRNDWNPASIYLRLGMLLAVVSLGVSAVAAVIVLMNLIPPFVSG